MRALRKEECRSTIHEANSKWRGYGFHNDDDDSIIPCVLIGCSLKSIVTLVSCIISIVKIYCLVFEIRPFVFLTFLSVSVSMLFWKKILLRSEMNECLSYMICRSV